METSSNDTSTQKQDKAKGVKPKSTMRRLDAQAAKLLSQLSEKVNKKEFGRRIKEIEILSLAVSLLKENHLKELQQQSLTEKDHLNMAHQEYQKKHGKLSLDQFIGKLLKGEVITTK